MHEPTPEVRKGGVTLIDLACLFAVLGVVGWQAVPYLLIGGIALFLFAVPIALVFGIVRLLPFLLRRGQNLPE